MEHEEVRDLVELAIGSRLKQIRLQRGFSRQDLAEHLGLSHQQVRRYEEGESSLAGSTLYRAATLLKVPIDTFFPLDGASIGQPVPVMGECVGFLTTYGPLAPADQKSLLGLLRCLAGSCPKGG